MNNQFLEDVKRILSGNIGTDDQNVIDYVALKIDRLHQECMDQVMDKLCRNPGSILTADEIRALLDKEGEG